MTWSARRAMSMAVAVTMTAFIGGCISAVGEDDTEALRAADEALGAGSGTGFQVNVGSGSGSGSGTSCRAGVTASDVGASVSDWTPFDGNATLPADPPSCSTGSGTGSGSGSGSGSASGSGNGSASFAAEADDGEDLQLELPPQVCLPPRPRTPCDCVVRGGGCSAQTCERTGDCVAGVSCAWYYPSLFSFRQCRMYFPRGHG